jgi:hypothetical protein
MWNELIEKLKNVSAKLMDEVENRVDSGETNQETLALLKEVRQTIALAYKMQLISKGEVEDFQEEGTEDEFEDLKKDISITEIPEEEDVDVDGVKDEEEEEEDDIEKILRDF